MAHSPIRVRQNETRGVTFVPNDFIDRYMAKAPGEYVKVYLCLLRCLYDREVPFSFDLTAGLLDSSEADIRRALQFWEDAELIHLERSGSTITGISICTPGAPLPSCSRQDTQTGNGSAAAASAGDDAASEALPDYTEAKLHVFAADDEISQVIFVAEQYLGHRLNHRELSCFYYWFRELSFPADLVIELADLSVSGGTPDIRQMHQTALEWHDAGVRTPKDARKFMKKRQEEQQQAAALRALQEKVCLAMGISGRVLNDSECSRISKWSAEWGFSDDMICEACRRTIANTHQASFEYADTILRNWRNAHIRDLDGIKAYDEAFRTRRAAGRQSSGRTDATPAASRRSKYSELELLTMSNI